MKEKLHISDIFKFLHTEFIKRYPLICNIYGGSLISDLHKLPAHHLIPLQVECAETALWNHLGFALPFHAIRNIIVGVWIVVYPVMIDWNKASEYAFIDYVHHRQPTTNVVFPVLYQGLDAFKLLNGDYGFVSVFV